jgi:hypothetical protein
MKRLFFILIAFLMLSSTSFATPITFTDTTLFTATGTNAQEDLVGYGWGAVNKLNGMFDYVAWKHQFAFVPPVKTILKASLSVYLTDDEADKSWNLSTWELAFGYAEDGSWDLGEIDTGVNKYGVNVAYLNNGEFDVKIISLGGDFYIDKSELQITYEPFAPVPEPSTLLLLGGGLLGLCYFGRKKVL